MGTLLIRHLKYALLIRHLKWVANNKMMFGERGVWLVWAVLEVPFHGVWGGVWEGVCPPGTLLPVGILSPGHD